MATNYPGSLDNFTNPTSASPINSPSHADQHSNANDAIEAIEGELGTNPKGAKATVKARLDDVDTSIATKAPIASPTFTGTVTIPSGSAIDGVPYLATANTFTGGVQQITTASAATKGLIIRGAASQTANLQEWQDSSGAANAFIDQNQHIFTSSGRAVFLNTGYIASTSFASSAFAPSRIAIIAKAAASQAANIQEWQNSSGTVLSAIDASGSFTSVSQPIRVAGSTYGFTHLVSVQYGATAYWKIATLPATSLSTCDQINIEAMLGAWTSTGKTKYEIMLGNRDTFAYKYTKFGDGSTQARIQSYTEADGSVSVYLYSENAYTTLAYNITLSAVTSGGDIGATIYKNPTASTTAPTGTKSFDTGEPTTYIPLMNMTNAGLLSTKSALFNPTSASAVPLIVKAAASQTANLQQWQNSAGTVLAKVDSTGTAQFLGLNVQGTGSGIVNIGTAASVYVGLIIKGVASQSANLQEWQDSSGTILSSISSGGVVSGKGLSITNPTNITNGATFYNSAGTVVFNVDTSLNAVNIGGGLSGIANNFASVWGYDSSLNAGYISFQTGALGGDSLAIRRTNHVASGDYTISTLGNFRLSTASGKNFNFNNGNIGIATTAIGTNNKIIVNAYSTVDNLATVQINTNAATNKGLVVQGIVSQTADLQQWQNSAGTVLTSVDKDGYLQTPRLVIINGGNIIDSAGTTPYFGFGSNQIAIYARNAAYKPLIIQGAASQTANLQEWQNSAGNVLSKVQPGGEIQSVGFISSYNSYFYSGTADAIPLRVLGATSQTGDLQQWQDSTGTVLAKVMSNGSLFINSTETANDPFTVQRASATRFKVDPYGNVFAGALTAGNVVTAIAGTTAGIYATSASTAGLIIKGASSQTASLQEWHSSTGTVTAKIANNGAISSISGGFFGTASAAITGGNYLAVRPWAANHVPFTVKGYSAQTGDLTRWVNDAGTTLAAVTSNGGIQAGTYNGVIISLNYPGIVIDTSNADNTQVWLRNLSETSKSGKFVGIKARNGYADAVAGDDLVTLEGQQYISSLGYASGKILISNDNSTPSATSYPARITFHTTAIGSTTLSERMRVDNAGLVGINMTPTDAYLSVTGSSSKDAIRLYSQYGLAFWGGGINNNLYTSGSMYMNGGDFAENAKLIIGTGATSNSGIVIRGVVGQTASLQEWKDSAGTSLSYIKSDGSLHFTANSNAVLISGTSTSGLNRIISNGNDLSFSPYFDGLFAPANSAGRWRPANDATSDLGSSGQRWKNLYATSGTLTNNSTSKVGLIVKAIASQTANLQEWQDSSGNAQAYVRYDGYINTNSSIRIAGDNLSVYRFQGVSDGNYTMNFPGSGNIQLFSAVDDLGGGSRVLGIKNATTVPTSNPTTGGILYVSSGALFYRGIGGAITAIARSGDESSTISANTATTVDTVALSSFTTIEYTISIKQGSKVRSSKILVHTDGTSVDSTEYGIMEMGGGITGILVTASVSSTNSILQVTITDASTTNATVKIIKTML